MQKEIGGTIYSVTGTYDGTETLNKEMERIMAEKSTEKREDSGTNPQISGTIEATNPAEGKI
ncbi:MAG: hypothetical protein ACI3XP_01185 [Eubacteriales bacterium]